MANRNSGEISFEILGKVGSIGSNQNGWSKEVNIVSWNGAQPKIDVREWDPTHERMTKGITLFEDEAKNLGQLLCDRLITKGETIDSIVKPTNTPDYAGA